jgi:hypothetical protein
VTVKLVDVAAVNVADVPLNLTVLLAALELKDVPEMVTIEPTGADDGVKLVMAGSTVKLVALAAVCPSFVTVIAPVVAPVGTVTAKLVVVASVPLNLMILLPV